MNKYAVTFNRRDDSTTGLRAMTFKEALDIVNFAATYTFRSGRIIPVQEN
jgi:hypothetical protein